MVLEVGGSNRLAWFRALDHARLVGVKPTWRVGDFYTVDSPSGKRYLVERIWGADRVIGYSCTCIASQAGKVCWHRALVAALPYEGSLRKPQQKVETE